MTASRSSVVFLVVLMVSSALAVQTQRVKRDKGGHHHQHAPIGPTQQYAPQQPQRPAYLPVPLPIQLQPASLILPSPPQSYQQPSAGGYAGSYQQQPQPYQQASQPAYQPLQPPPPPQQPQYQQPQYQPPPPPPPAAYQPQVAPPPPQPTPYQPPAPQQPEYQQPSAPQQYAAPPPPAPQQPEYQVPAPQQPEYQAPAPQEYSAPAASSYQSAPVEPLLPPPLYARQPQQTQQQTAPEAYAQAPAQDNYAVPAPAAESSSNSQYYAPVQDNAAPVYDASQPDQPAQSGSYAPSEPVTVPPVADELNSYSTAAPVQYVDQDIRTNAIAAAAPSDVASAPTQTSSSGSQWSEGSIPWTLEKLGQNTLNDLLVLSGLDEQFDKEGPFTVFVPVDQAFEILIQRFGGMEKATEEFNKNPDVLDSLLKHHVVAGSVQSSSLQNNGVMQSLLGTPLRVKFYESEDNEWRPLKVITVNGARIVKPDIQATNGVIHIVDRVIFPIPQGPIYTTLKNDSRYSILVSAIEKAGLATLLADPTGGPYTIFAPTNKAFSLISPAELNGILEDPAKLTKLLQRHVVQDLIYTSGLQGFQKAYALDFEILYIYHAKGMTKVNGANVIDQDMTTLNGVIHTIDSVLGLY